MSETLISIAILNYRRQEALARTLESVREQSYSSREIIVVDNGSEEDISSFLTENFPEVRLVALQQNIGSAARNYGMEAARGEIVVTLDNDVYFDTAFELQKVVNMFEESPEASCIAFKVLDAKTKELHLRDWCHPRSYQEFEDADFETYFIPEGACAFRRSHFLRTGGYFEPLWIGCEGWDLALRLIDLGGRIFYKPAIRVCHMISGETRTSWRPYYYYTRNYIWIVARNYKLAGGISFLTGKLAMMALFAIRSRNLGAYFRGIWDGVREAPRVLKTRRPLLDSTWTTLRSLSSERPSLIARFRRHRERSLL